MNQEEGVALRREKYEVCCGLSGPIHTAAGVLAGSDRSKWLPGALAEHLAPLPAAQEHILRHENRKNRFRRLGRPVLLTRQATSVNSAGPNSQL